MDKYVAEVSDALGGYLRENERPLGAIDRLLTDNEAKTVLLGQVQRWLIDALTRNQIVHQIDRDRAYAFVDDIGKVLNGS